MKNIIALALLVPLLSFGDIAPEGAAECTGKSAGSACTLPGGIAGQCQTVSVTRPDYSKGVPPGSKQVEMVLCVATTTASARSMNLAVLAALALGMFGVASLWRRRALHTA